MSTKPPLPRLPLAHLGLALDEENFINDMVKLSAERLAHIINDIAQTTLDLDPRVGGIALQLSLHSLSIGIQSKLLEFEAQMDHGKHFVDCSSDERKTIVQHYLETQKHSALTAYRAGKEPLPC